MKVFRGRLVHSVDAQQGIQVLEDRLIGVENRTGKVSGCGLGVVYIVQLLYCLGDAIIILMEEDPNT